MKVKGGQEVCVSQNTTWKGRLRGSLQQIDKQSQRNVARDESGERIARGEGMARRCRGGEGKSEGKRRRREENEEAVGSTKDPLLSFPSSRSWQGQRHGAD